ncbi:MAG: class I SAM-dependent methyltransferase [Rhodospirillaceae bacterium]
MVEALDTHDVGTPSAWITRWACIVPRCGAVLDVACGSGRHARWFAARGHRVDAVDRDPEAIASLAGVDRVAPLCSDIENGPWPYAGRIYAAIVVANYLHRPLFPVLLDALAPGGVLLYETFAAGNERYGRPRNPAFLLQPGELLEIVRGRLRVVAYEDVELGEPRPACVQRICALR